jgi:hypothetical protein
VEAHEVVAARPQDDRSAVGRERRPLDLRAFPFEVEPVQLLARGPDVGNVIGEAVVLRCLGKKPEGRFPDAGAVDEALAGCACAGGWSARQAAAWWRVFSLTATGPED